MQTKSHFLSVVPQNILRGEKKNQIQIYCLKLDGGEQKSLKLLQFIIQRNKKMRRKDMVRSLSAKL